MPTYLLKCDNEHYFDRYLKLAHYNDPQTCDCGAPAKRQITAPMIAPMFEDYESPIDGKPITSKAKRIEDLARSGCVPYETGVVENSTKIWKDSEAKLEQEFDKTIDMEISKMSAKQQDKLDQELRSGADIEYKRV